jgi:hypothetical protein
VTPKVVGMLQSGNSLDVTLVSFVDPAPVYRPTEHAATPQAGDHLVAAQLRIHNKDAQDYLVDPVTEVSVLGSDGHEYSTSLAATSAGVMLDQVSLARDQTVLGYVTIDVPDHVAATELRYEPKSDHALTWQVSAGRAPQRPVAWPDARKSTHPLGYQATITDNGRQNTVAAIRLTDHATPQNGVQAGEQQHVAEVDFVVFAGGGNDAQDDPGLRIMTLYDAADQPVNAFIGSMNLSVHRPLNPGEQVTWAVQFIVPDDFVPDHVSYRPEYGRATTTQWALS